MSGDATPPTPLHPAFTISNIHNYVSTKLTLDESVYETWKLLFEVHCESFQVDGHLDGTSTPANDSDSTWKRLDSTVLSWIYATLSPTVRTMVIKKGATAHEIWTKIDSIFNDHKDSRALQLSDEFYHFQKGNLTITQYCERLHSLSKSLIAVGRNISDDELVLQLLRGLPGEYATIAKVLPLQKPLPSFLNVMGLLLMEEKRIAENTDTSSLQPAAALTVTGTNAAPSTHIAQNHQSNNNPNWRNNNHNNTNSNGGFRGGWRGSRNTWRGGRGRGNGGFRGGYNEGGYRGGYQNYNGNQYGCNHGPLLCFAPFVQPGILGPGPQQRPSSTSQVGHGLLATTVSSSPLQQPNSSYASSPTTQWPYGQTMEPQALVHAFDTMSLQPPPSGTWHMDTGATDHMTQDPGPCNQTGTYPM